MNNKQSFALGIVVVIMFLMMSHLITTTQQQRHNDILSFCKDVYGCDDVMWSLTTGLVCLGWHDSLGGSGTTFITDQEVNDWLLAKRLERYLK